MLGPLDREGAVEPQRRQGERGIGVGTFLEAQRRRDLAAGDAGRFGEGHHRGFLIQRDAGEPGRPTRRLAGHGNHREDRLAVIENALVRENRMIPLLRAAVIHGRDVLGGQHRNDIRRPAHGIEIDRLDAAAHRIGATRRDMDGAERLAQIIDEGGGAADMGCGIVMGKGSAEDAGLRPARAHRSLAWNLKRDAQAAPPAAQRCGLMRRRRRAPRSRP